jgi:hypothetical protein
MRPSATATRVPSPCHSTLAICLPASQMARPLAAPLPPPVRGGCISKRTETSPCIAKYGREGQMQSRTLAIGFSAC